MGLSSQVEELFEYSELKASYFTPTAGDLLNDLFLGLSVIALAMIFWIVYLLIKDPKGTIRASLFKNAR